MVPGWAELRVTWSVLCSFSFWHKCWSWRLRWAMPLKGLKLIKNIPYFYTIYHFAYELASNLIQNNVGLSKCLLVFDYHTQWPANWYEETCRNIHHKRWIVDGKISTPTQKYEKFVSACVCKHHRKTHKKTYMQNLRTPGTIFIYSPTCSLKHPPYTLEIIYMIIEINVDYLHFP